MGTMGPPFDIKTLPTGQVMRLSPLVSRLLAPNPSPYTYTGTQSYIIGRNEGAAGDVAVIDPGPADEAHLAALMAAIAGRRVKAICCTHTHRDHSPAAAPLAAMTGATIIGCAPLTMKDDGPRVDAAFDADYRPDEVMRDGALLRGDGWTLEAVATPGHTSNHLCFALHQEKALFTGDHIMGWSTTVISPPDGDMADYMHSMQKLLDRDDVVFYPAHGDAIEKPQRLVRGMMGHRKHREGQIIRLLQSAPGGMAIGIGVMVEEMYKGLDPALHGAASRSVLAHLLDLEKRGLVHGAGEGLWKAPSS